MNNRKVNYAVPDVEMSKPLRVETTVVHFEGSEDIVFEPVGENGMEVRMTGLVVPDFEGMMFAPEYLDFLREHNMSGIAMDMMFDGAKDGLRKGMLIDALMGRMK